jgi:hypothetical protein
MSGGDNPFSRWSRRKLAARQNALVEKAAQDAGPEPQAGIGAEPVEGEAAAAGPVLIEPADALVAGTPEPLPRLEDLDAGSDLSAFLRNGVPDALKNSALRRMWSLDPAIRDHVGLAEYAWDFNTPGSMPGFGPLEPGSTLVDFLSTTARSVLSGGEEEAEPARPAAEAKSAGPDAEIPSGSHAGAASEEPAQEEANPGGPESSPDVAAHPEMVPEDKPAPAESSPEPIRPRHGGALPR